MTAEEKKEYSQEYYKKYKERIDIYWHDYYVAHKSELNEKRRERYKKKKGGCVKVYKRRSK